MIARYASVLLLVFAACDQAPVDWHEPVAIPTPAPGSHLTIDSAGDAKFVAGSARAASTPVFPGLCVGSFRTVAGTVHIHSVWWNVRPDSSAVLDAASSSDSGKTWGIPQAVDTSDVSSRGCSRPSPSVATVGDDLYVAYSMTASEGTGVFSAHTMASMLHSPVAVIYGERLVSTAIAVDGVHVAVAYEQPNGKRKQIDVALSRTQGHIFERHFTATRDVDVAILPSVALADHSLAVSWTARPFGAGPPSQVVRAGHLR